jgi:hypothetical protein
MRNFSKAVAPEILTQNQQRWSEEYLNNPSENNRVKYRHPDIKSALINETHSKCVYCESKVGHNCPGDVEHKSPVAHQPNLLFDWSNLTIACNECNRRKLDYYDPQCMFLDPYNDDVEARLQHIGPLVFSKPNDAQADVSIRILELDKPDRRKNLIGRKFEKLEDIRNFVERITITENAILKQFLMHELNERCSPKAEFSAMVKSYVDGLPDGWDEQN